MVFLLQLCCYQTQKHNTIVQAATNLQAADWHQEIPDLDTRNQKEPRYEVSLCTAPTSCLAAHRLALLEAMPPVYKEEMILRMKSDLQGENWKIQLSSSNSEHHCLLHQLYILCSNS